MPEHPFPLPLTIDAAPEDAGQRLDQFLVAKFAAQLGEISRVRVQELISAGKIRLDGSLVKPSVRLRGGERISILAMPQRPPLRAHAEAIPLDIVYEDDDLAIVNKPAGMMVHAGAGRSEAGASRGTLVNALLHRFGGLSGMAGELRPGIVHRLDRMTSGLIVVAKNDFAHRRLADQFAAREVKKKYLALVHGWLKMDKGTIETAISRDRVRRIRMTTRRRGGREAVTHYRLLQRVASPWGRFTLLDLKIDTGRTHQIRVHLSSLGHPVVGDTLYGAPRQMALVSDDRAGKASANSASLPRNFLHAAAIELKHPRTGAPLAFSRPLPPELEEFLARLKGRAPSKQI